MPKMEILSLTRMLAQQVALSLAEIQIINISVLKLMIIITNYQKNDLTER